MGAFIIRRYAPWPACFAYKQKCISPKLDRNSSRTNGDQEMENVGGTIPVHLMPNVISKGFLDIGYILLLFITKEFVPS